MKSDALKKSESAVNRSENLALPMVESRSIVKKQPIGPPQEGALLVTTAANEALSTRLLAVESSVVAGPVGLQLIGNAAEICRDGRERARAALEASGFHLPPKRIILNLTPADVKKDGSHFDLPMAVSLLLLRGQKPKTIEPSRWLFAGELGLDGSLRPVRGVVSFALAAMRHGLDGIVVAKDNLRELQVLTGLCEPLGPKACRFFAFSHISEVAQWLVTGKLSSQGSNEVGLTSARPLESASNIEQKPLQGCAWDFDDMLLTSEQSLAAQVIATGMHSALLRGPPGTGKSMFAQRIPSVLPTMGRSQHIEALCIHSSQHERVSQSLLQGRPPYRSPHHQASAAALLGTPDGPGELSLAHGGVLFLDEFPEFRRDLIESLREPLETGEVTVSRARSKIRWQGAALLLAAANNCPCGNRGSARVECNCSERKVLAYQARMSGPILDRIDLHLTFCERNLRSSDLLLAVQDTGDCLGQTARLKKSISIAYEFQKQRNAPFGVTHNCDLRSSQLLEASGLSKGDFSSLVDRVLPKSLGNRAVGRCLKVGRTLADIAGRDRIESEDLRQALLWQVRPAMLEGRGQWQENGVTV